MSRARQRRRLTAKWGHRFDGTFDEKTVRDVLEIWRTAGVVTEYEINESTVWFKVSSEGAPARACRDVARLLITARSRA